MYFFSFDSGILNQIFKQRKFQMGRICIIVQKENAIRLRLKIDLKV